MKSPLLHAWALRMSALGFFFPGVWLLSSEMWGVSVPLLYCSMLFAWLSGGEMRQHRRNTAEFIWKMRRANGEQPPPLNPCCLMFRDTEEQVHAEAVCTRVYSPRQIDETFDEIVAHYSDALEDEDLRSWDA